MINFNEARGVSMINSNKAHGYCWSAPLKPGVFKKYKQMRKNHIYPAKGSCSCGLQ